MSKKPVVLMVLDGYGLNDRTEGNAIAMANTPVMDKLMKECPFQKGYASGLAVGLPDGQMGNSEVGHMNIGAGRIIYQDLTRITKDIEDGTFFKNEELLEAMENCKKNDSDLHLFGLLSDGGVHSHLSHVYGLLEMAKQQGVSKVYVHAFLDGRDTPPASAKGFVETLENKMAEIGVGKVASLSGRYYAMDRDNNWDRVEKAYDSLVTGDGIKAESATQALQESYDNGKTDEFVEPTVICNDGQPLSLVKADDSVIFFNFRPDRAREMTRAFCDDKFTGFERKTGFIPLTFVCFKDYDESIPNKKVAFKKENIKNTFGEFLANHGKKQLRLAETEKYAHVTFFFNGGVEDPNVDEFRLLVNSPKDVATYDLKPEMSAPEVGMDLVEAIKSDKYDVIIINFAILVLIHTGAVRVSLGTLSQGQVVALYNYMSQILVELIKLANLIISVTKAMACFNRIQDVFHIEPSMKEGTKTVAAAGNTTPAVEFKNVSFTYAGGGDHAVENISFKAMPGQTIGIIGGTGSGKSTLVNLIPRFYDVSEGEVDIAGKNIQDYTYGSLRNTISVVPQKAQLFAGTIRDNLTFGCPDATEEQIEEALAISQAKEFVDTKEGRLDAKIEQGGKNLSGGQRQRLTLARALVPQSDILIMDDSASALDYATDARLRKAIQDMKRKPTVFIVSQRTSSIQNADMILVLDDGKIAGQGTHEQLLKSCNIYREIYETQFKKEEA